MDGLQWSKAEKEYGKIVKIKGFPKDHKVKLFRVVLPTQRTDYAVTNDFAQNNTQAVQEVCGLRWKIEQFHRETKQLAQETQRTIYQVKQGLLSDYLRQQLRSPTIQMALA